MSPSGERGKGKEANPKYSDAASTGEFVCGVPIYLLFDAKPTGLYCRALSVVLPQKCFLLSVRSTLEVRICLLTYSCLYKCLLSPSCIYYLASVIPE